MELRALHYFVTVADELHFGRAAERLGIAQPAVSQQVARLERELGVRLLDRSPRAVRLTETGEHVLDAAREALAAAERVRAAAGKLVPTVRIGIAPGIVGRLERGIDALHEVAPGFEPVLVDLPIADLPNALRRGELHFALVRGMQRAEGLRVQQAWSEPLHAVVSARHPAAEQEIVTLRELAGLVLRLPARDADPPLHEAVTAAFEAIGAEPRLGRPAGTTQSMLIEVGSDPGSWALLPAEQVTQSKRVRSIPLDPPIAVPGVVAASVDLMTDACTDAIVKAFS